MRRKIFPPTSADLPSSTDLPDQSLQKEERQAVSGGDPLQTSDHDARTLDPLGPASSDNPVSEDWETIEKPNSM